MELLSTSGFDLLQRSLDASALRHKVVANNVANVDTPNFKRSDVRFEDLLARELEAVKAPMFTAYRTHAKHIEFRGSTAKTQPQVTTDETTAFNNNRNNVDIDLEMSLLAKNQMYYNTLITQVNHQIKHLRTAIGGRG